MRILLPLFLACAAFAADSDGPACPANSKPFAPSNSDWNGWGLDATNTRFQARPGLAAKDVPKLKVKWAFAFQGDVRTVSQPTVMGGRVFVSSWGGKVYSLDAATGCTYWVYDAQSIARTAIQIHGAMGYSWELDLQFYAKRAWSLIGLGDGRAGHVRFIHDALRDGRAALGPDALFAASDVAASDLEQS